VLVFGRLRRYLEPQLLRDLKRKTVVLTGARQVGKTTLARQLMEHHPQAQVLNWDVPAGCAEPAVVESRGRPAGV
jgi:predicted AAA+ superfamily ATPase